MPKYFDSFEQAAEGSKMRLAVSGERFTVEHNGKAITIEIMKPRHGDAYAVYQGGHIRVAGFKVPSSLIDQVRRWKIFV